MTYFQTVESKDAILDSISFGHGQHTKSVFPQKCLHDFDDKPHLHSVSAGLVSV